MERIVAHLLDILDITNLAPITEQRPSSFIKTMIRYIQHLWT